MPIKKNDDEYVGNYANPDYREKHKKYIMQKVTCRCGHEVLYCNISHHKQTLKHQRAMETIENDPNYHDDMTVMISEILNLVHALDGDDKPRAYALLKKVKKDIDAFVT